MRPKLRRATTPPPDRHKLVYATRSQGDAWHLKELIYYYNRDTVRSVRINWREDGPDWWYLVSVWTDAPLIEVLENCMDKMPLPYRTKVLGWHRRHYGLRPALRRPSARPKLRG